MRRSTGETVLLSASVPLLLTSIFAVGYFIMILLQDPLDGVDRDTEDGYTMDVDGDLPADKDSSSTSINPLKQPLQKSKSHDDFTTSRHSSMSAIPSPPKPLFPGQSEKVTLPATPCPAAVNPGSGTPGNPSTPSYGRRRPSILGGLTSTAFNQSLILHQTQANTPAPAMSKTVQHSLVNIGTSRARNWLQLYNPADPISPTPNAYGIKDAVPHDNTFKWGSTKESGSEDVTLNCVENNRITSKAVPIAVQAGGLSWKKRPFLKLNPDYALKPLPADHRGYREAGFYEMVALSCEKYSKRKRIALRLSSSDDTPSDQTKIDDGIDGKEVELLSRLAHFVPSYYGIINEKNDDTNHNGKNSNRNYPKIPAPVATSHQSNLTNNAWLLLRDTTATFSRPCVIDIKIGKQTYEPGSSIEKVNEERTKYLEQTTFGFRITGMNIYDPHHADADKGDGYRKYNKHFGRGLHTRGDIKSALESFFSQTGRARTAGKEEDAEDPKYLIKSERTKGRGGVRNRVLIELRRQLKVLANWFKDNKCFHFYSSSILFVYEGDENAEATRDNAKLRMIDFAHVLRKDTIDTSYLDGLYGIMRIVDEILGEQEKTGKLRED